MFYLSKTTENEKSFESIEYPEHILNTYNSVRFRSKFTIIIWIMGNIN